MATEIICPYCQALLLLAAVDNQVQVTLKEEPKPAEEKTDDDLLTELLGGPEPDDDNKD